eukprot:CAMPEP_0115886404 /NCGR_PEP_ID=MMETSP0287-20121206/31186_1 /TAXON_ID=412157 /ORGANISM="Chrysochromulina rotalis, Strain UIO044" /LENGTH=185 /DNA_ID=CAMNT_0003342879 /DNA_START=24 /DNA_END=579 /DNA_ORIENTATION=-
MPGMEFTVRQQLDLCAGAEAEDGGAAPERPVKLVVLKRCAKNSAVGVHRVTPCVVDPSGLVKLEDADEETAVPVELLREEDEVGGDFCNELATASNLAVRFTIPESAREQWAKLCRFIWKRSDKLRRDVKRKHGGAVRERPTVRDEFIGDLRPLRLTCWFVCTCTVFLWRGVADVRGGRAVSRLG